jgi:hypothetical protein
MNAKSPMPGERWLVNLQPVDAAPQKFREVTVTLKDFDPRTQAWSAAHDGQQETVTVLAKHLLKRVD